MNVMRAVEVRRVLREHLSRDVEVIYRRHACRRRDERGVSEVDVLHILRGGWCDESRGEVDAHGEASDRVTTNRHYVVAKLFTEPEGILVVPFVRFGRNRCTECAAPLPRLQVKLVPYLTSLGLDIQVETSIYACEACGEVFEGFTRVQDLHRAIVDHITARPDALQGEEVGFLRKHLGLSSKDLKERRGVDPATVSRWRSGKQQMTSSHDRMLRLLARLGPLVEQYEPHPSPDWTSSIALRPDVDGWKARAAD